MAVNLKNAKGQLPATAGALFTVPAGETWTVRHATFVNNDNTNRTVTLYRVPASGSAAAANRLIDGKALAPSESWICAELINAVFEAGESLQGFGGDGGSITYWADLLRTT